MVQKSKLIPIFIVIEGERSSYPVTQMDLHMLKSPLLSSHLMTEGSLKTWENITEQPVLMDDTKPLVPTAPLTEK